MKKTILTSRDVKSAPVVWSGGNPRTEQRQEFTWEDRLVKTQHIIDQNADEVLARAQATFRPDGGADRLNPEQQLGRALHIHELVALIRRMNPAVIFEVTHRDPTKGGFYVEQWGNDIRTGQAGKFKKLVAGCENGWMPEFSVMAPRLEERPTENATMEIGIQHAYEKTRGWRTVLAKLHVAGLITESQIEQEFTIAEGRSSELWQKQIHAPITVP